MLTKNAISLLAGTLLSCVLWTLIASAGEPRTHDGFFLRLSAGAGPVSSKINPPGGSLKFSGTAGDVNLAIGGVVQPNLAIHGTIFGFSASDPDVDVTVFGVGSASGTLNGDVTMSAFGGGVTYYFMPVNMYASGSVGFGSLSVSSDDVDLEGETDNGLVLDLTLGKEWWVGDSWGLGVAGGFGYHSLPDKGIEEKWSGTSFGIRFSATRN